MAGISNTVSHPPPSESNIRSNKELWVLISGLSVLKSQELVAVELNSNSDKLINGISYYKKPSPDSAKALVKEKKISGTQLEFIQKLSRFLDLDQLQCYDVFCSYLLHEYRGSQKGLKNMLSNDRHIENLIFLIWKYYWSERLYLLLSMKHITTHWLDNQHPYYELYKGFFQTYNEENKIIKKIISQFEAVCTLPVPLKDSHGALMSDAQISQWASFNLKEQCELLQIIVLYFKDLACTPEIFKQLLTIFQKHGFGRRQNCKHFVNDTNETLVATISFLEALIIIENMELEWLFLCQEKESNEEYYLLQNEDIWKQVDSIICSLGLVREESPVILGWMTVRYLSAQDANTTKCLGNTALHQDVLEYIHQMLSLPLFANQTIIANLSHTVIYGLMTLLLSIFEIGSIGKVKDLLSISELLLKHSNICEDMWDKGLDVGVGTILKFAVEHFPYRFHPLLRLLSSIASCEKPENEKVLNFFSHLPCYSESVNNLENCADISPGDDDSCWILHSDHKPYGSDSLLIPRGTKGILLNQKEKNNVSLLQWQMSVNGWQICLCETDYLLQKASQGLGQVSERMIERILDIAELICSVLSANSKTKDLFNHILLNLQAIWQRFFAVPNPPMLLLAKQMEILSILAIDKTKDVWHSLSQSGMLPFIHKMSSDIATLSSGVDMNVGMLGGVIASQECVNGNYKLTLAFLKLMANSVEVMSQLNDSNFLASELFVLHEIFPFFYKWRYKSMVDRTNIGLGCLTVIHKLLNISKDNDSNKRLISQEICLHALFHSSAGQTLLLIVGTGEENISSTLEQQTSWYAGFGGELLELVRLSLSVLNRLLMMKPELRRLDKKEHSPSPMEQILCSQPAHHTQPHIVLIVAYYGFHRFDPRLATLAIVLLKRFAKELSISLMACLGNEAEVIRDLYLMRFEAITEDIRLKISLLEFLTVCVSSQPGLLEMFINIPLQNSNQEVGKKQPSCLQHVIEILKERKEAVHFCPVELHSAAVEFLQAIWKGWRNIALYILKKNPNFWSILCDPLMEDTKSGKNIDVSAFVMKILALELHYSNLAMSGSCEEDLQNTLKKLTTGNCIFYWSEIVQETLQSVDLSFDETNMHDTSEHIQETTLLVIAWRDLLVILAKNKTIFENKQKQKLSKDLLDLLLSHSLELHNPKIVGLMAELIILLMNNWKCDCIDDCKAWAECIGNLLTRISINQDPITARSMLAVVSIATLFLQLVPMDMEEKLEGSLLATWISPVCVLINTSAFSLQQITSSDFRSIHQQFPMLCISLLQELIVRIDSPSYWLPSFIQHSTVSYMLSVMTICMQAQKAGELVSAILVFLLTLSLSSESAEILSSNNLMQHVCLPLSYTYTNIDQSLELQMNPLNMNKKDLSPWYIVYQNSLKLVSSMLKTQKHFFFEDALNFVGVHLDRMLLSLMRIKFSLSIEDLDAAVVTLNFINQLSFYKQSWKMHHQASLTALLGAVCSVCQSSIAFLIRPNFIQHIIDHKSKLSSQIVLDEERQRIRRLSSTEDVEKPSPQLLQIQTKVLGIISVSLSTLRHFTPDLCEILLGQNIDVSYWEPVLDCGFNTPAIDQDFQINFGSMISCVSVCIRALTKNERAPSPGKSVPTESSLQVDRNLLLFVLENALMLLVSQALLYLLLPSLTSRDKQLIKRELGTELNSFAMSMNRYLRRGCLAQSPSVTSLVSPGSSFRSNTFFTGNQPFVRLVTMIVDKLFK